MVLLDQALESTALLSAKLVERFLGVQPNMHRPLERRFFIGGLDLAVKTEKLFPV